MEQPTESTLSRPPGSPLIQPGEEKTTTLGCWPVTVFTVMLRRAQREKPQHAPWRLSSASAVLQLIAGSQGIAQSVKNLPAKQGTRVQFLGGEDLLESEMATHFSILTWRIP